MNYTELVAQLATILGITTDNFILYFVFEVASSLFLVFLLGLLICFPLFFFRRWLS